MNVFEMLYRALVSLGKRSLAEWNAAGIPGFESPVPWEALTDAQRGAIMLGAIGEAGIPWGDYNRALTEAWGDSDIREALEEAFHETNTSEDLSDRRAFEIFAKLHPVEAYASDPARFRAFFEKQCPGVSVADMEAMIEEAKKENEG